MTTSTLLQVLRDTVELLRSCDRGREADWIEERRLILQSEDTPLASRVSAKAELHGIVLGMGGLTDLSLTPEVGALPSAESARERLDRLSDSLYRLSR